MALDPNRDIEWVLYRGEFGEPWVKWIREMEATGRFFEGAKVLPDEQGQGAMTWWSKR
jgi:hypothetical protein